MWFSTKDSGRQLQDLKQSFEDSWVLSVLGITFSTECVLTVPSGLHPCIKYGTHYLHASESTSSFLRPLGVVSLNQITEGAAADTKWKPSLMGFLPDSWSKVMVFSEILCVCVCACALLPDHKWGAQGPYYNGPTDSRLPKWVVWCCCVSLHGISGGVSCQIL